MDTNENLLRAILATVARQAFPPAELARLITANSGGPKQITAYNLCDGQTPQKEISSQAELDKGSLSRSITRWVELGIVIRVGREQNPMHLYPLPKEHSKPTTKEIGEKDVRRIV